MSYFAVNEDDTIFRIQTDQVGKAPYSGFAVSGKGTLVEFSTDSWGRVTRIECIYMGEVLHEPTLAATLPDIRTDKRISRVACITCSFGEECGCVVNVIPRELNIIFSADLDDIGNYFKDGRVEYYYNNEFELQYIKVLDLTDEEYAFLA
jgi:hypothetical protein